MPAEPVRGDTDYTLGAAGRYKEDGRHLRPGRPRVERGDAAGSPPVHVDALEVVNAKDLRILRGAACDLRRYLQQLSRRPAAPQVARGRVHLLRRGRRRHSVR